MNHTYNPAQEDDFDQTLRRRRTTSYLRGGHYTGTGVKTVNLVSLPLV